MILEKNQVVNRALEIRAFEQHLLYSFKLGLLRGTTHTCIGQELLPAALSMLIPKNTFVVSNHRNHGHFLGTGGSSLLLLRELIGKVDGVSHGLGGSQHIHTKNFLSHGILGGLLPLAVGKAAANNINSNNEIVIAFIGDGTFGEGVTYESLNLAAIYRCPVLFIVEDNGVSQSTKTEEVLSSLIETRIKSFFENCVSTNDDNYELLVEKLKSALNLEIDSTWPRALVVKTARLGPHSKGEVSLDPWLGIHDPVFKVSASQSKEQFRKLSTAIYEQTSRLFNSELKNGSIPYDYLKAWSQES